MGPISHVLVRKRSSTIPWLDLIDPRSSFILKSDNSSKTKTKVAIIILFLPVKTNSYLLINKTKYFRLRLDEVSSERPKIDLRETRD